jgi:hypothetical protein
MGVSYASRGATCRCSLLTSLSPSGDALDGAPDSLFGEARVAEKEDGVTRAHRFDDVNGGGRKRVDANAVIGQPPLEDRRGSDAGRQMPGHVHATLGAVDATSAKMVSQLVQQTVAAREVAPSNPVKVPLETAAVQELRDRRLFEPRVAVVEKGLGADGRRRQRRWEDDVAQSKRRADRFGESAEVDRGLCAVERIKGQERGLLISKVAVVVVFDHVGARLRRPVEQRQASRERQGWPERKLVRRGHVGESRLAGKSVDAEPFVVHRTGHELRPVA